MKPRQEFIVSKILEYVYIGANYAPTMRAIRNRYPMCENTFMKYWKLAQKRHWDNCNDIEKRVQNEIAREWVCYKELYGDL